MTHVPQSPGASLVRREAREKVTGTARYAADVAPPGCLYAWPVPATIAAGRVAAVRAVDALAVPGVHTVLTHDNAPTLEEPDDPILSVLQNDRVPHHGWPIALVIAESPEAARTGAGELLVAYERDPHDVTLSEDHPGLYTPEEANGGHPAVRERGDVDKALASAPVQIDATYRMGALHNHPMEPHAATASWSGGHLTVHDSSQGSATVRGSLARVFGLDPDRITVVSEHVGGGFGSKGTTRPQAVLAAMAARHTGRPVTLAFPRGQLAEVVGHRAPTVQRVRLGADLDGTLSAVCHEAVTHTSTVKEFVEQAAVPARVMYASPHSRTAHRVAVLDVPSPSWMRAPGEASGMYALESAMDELASALGLDPVELRLRNEPETEPDSGRPFSSHGLAACLREGAARFGWHDRDPRPAARQEGRWLLGTGVASATYPVLVSRSTASAHAAVDGTYRVEVNATDIGTGARTVLARIAADALGTDPDAVAVAIGSTELPTAPLAGGSSGTASWGWAVHKAASELADRLAAHSGPLPAEGLTASADTEQETAAESPYARHAFGAHFAETAVDAVTGEVRVRRLLGVYAAGRILNAATARSQFTGGMVMGIGMALTEGSGIDPAFGDFTAKDLASYHVPVCADTADIRAHWIEEDDRHLNPMGSKGIGEIGIVGTAAAIGNAVRHATGARLRELPLTPDRLLPYLL
ncbi:xanthine dehydrogenase family protein molybdopterin-binding subunit [Streptomyces sp. C11-1]|uniref:Xanthine dehydrogenase family protein molybdopterin-binding subunit n=1 Tax=Streptomyces durocortorensis TaxID=2811104 RepID=A0ABY9VNY1_9ACTN|nr:xanthine dehydrogenase family protein molybdopterin-binding subunit [Streptomyces durocortorensis]WNF25513.1 xanthine dehydrogenase family protein molybdopterin-binding subunit [Streptomyces durocortorensis]